MNIVNKVTDREEIQKVTQEYAKGKVLEQEEDIKQKRNRNIKSETKAQENRNIEKVKKYEEGTQKVKNQEED